MRRAMFAAVTLFISAAASAQSGTLPPAIYTDPPKDAAHPARMEVLHIPTGGVAINGVAYLAAGAGPRPTVVICHGLPGIEKNLDLAQAARRGGWNAITFNYRGSWGSPGNYRLAQNPQDAKAVLAFLRKPDVAARYGIDVSRLAVIGHSMGGWVAATIGGEDDALLGVALISAANMGQRDKVSRADLIAFMADNKESLAGVTAEQLADEVIQNSAVFDFTRQARGLSQRHMLILSSDDGLAPETDALAAAVRAVDGSRLEMQHVATDHSWSDQRIHLQALILNWLTKLAN